MIGKNSIAGSFNTGQMTAGREVHLSTRKFELQLQFLNAFVPAKVKYSNQKRPFIRGGNSAEKNFNIDGIEVL